MNNLNSLLYGQFSKQFKDQSLLNKGDIARFFHEYEPGLSESTIAWRIYDLRDRKIITDVKKGLYRLNNKQDFFPEPDTYVIDIANMIKREYEPQFYTVWDTVHLNQLTELQAVNTSIVLEVEKGLINSVFFGLKRAGFLNVFTSPDAKQVELYITGADHPVIIKPFLGRAPVQIINYTAVPALEKVLVDLYCDDQVYYPWQGSQLGQIYKNATEKYNLNYTKLFNYAKRRHRDAEIKNLLLETAPDELKTIIA